ncbi:MAG: ABC transporter permease [Propionibacterium sp.]|nr:ABC transporter permease [Propionibacterium sp.]
MLVFFSIVGGRTFLSSAGVSSWLNVAAELGIIALPVGLLMIAGELDLSVGSVLAASSMTTSIVSGNWGMPVFVGILSGLALGLLVGAANGLVVTRTRVPSFVVTLATNFSVAGITLALAIALTGSTSSSLSAGEPAKTLLGSLIGGQFEVAVIWWALAVAVVGWLLHVSKYGNWIFAIGGDLESARTMGIPINGVKIALYMSSALGAALVGVIQAILYNGAQVAAGQAFVFNSIIAVVIGGVLLTGGYGSVVGIVMGTLTFAIVNQGIYFSGWDANLASLILGLMLLAAVLMNNTFRRMALSYSPKSKPVEQGRR